MVATSKLFFLDFVHHIAPDPGAEGEAHPFLVQSGHETVFGHLVSETGDHD